MAKSDISNLAVRTEVQTTNLWISWTPIDQKFVKVTKGSGNKKKTLYTFTGYKVKWSYQVPGSSYWYPASENTISSRTTHTANYSYPTNANKVKVWIKVIYKKEKGTPPKVKEHTKEIVVKASGFVPATPSLSHEIDKNNKLTITSAQLSQEEINKGTDQIWFNIQKASVNANGSEKRESFKSCEKINISKNTYKASYSVSLASGYYYYYRALAYNSKNGYKSDLSSWSDKVYTHAEAPSNLVVVSDTSTSAKVSFYVKGYVEGYEVQYATEEKYLGTDSEFAQNSSWNEEDRTSFTHNVSHIIGNLETGHNYFFRVRANSGSAGYSSWSDPPVILTIGREPGPPSTYSSKTAAEIGETVNLYWVHNSQDGSSQTQAQIALYINNESGMLGDEPITYDNPYIGDDINKDKTLSYPISLITNSHYDVNHGNRVYSFKDGDTLFWKVRTKGVYSGKSGTNVESFSKLFIDANDNQNVVLSEVPTTINSFAIGIGSILSPIMIDVPSIHYSISNNVLTIYPTVLSVLNSEDPQYNTRIRFHIAYSYYTNGYGDWSTTRQISMYQQPDAQLLLKTDWTIDPEDPDDLTPIDEAELTDEIDSYPIAIVMSATPPTQEVISFNLTITNAGLAYETTNALGEPITVGANEIIYQRYFDKGIDKFDDGDANKKTLILYPSDVIFQDGESYTFTLEAYMNSGLSATDSLSNIPVTLDEAIDFYVDASITAYPETFTATIQPRCFDDDGEVIPEEQVIEDDPEGIESDVDTINAELLTENVLLDVYRLETDGSTTLIAKNLENNGWTTITDPYPSLDYARYRIVARKTTTAQADYMDYIDEEMGVKSLVLQWDETWADYSNNYEAALEEAEDMDQATDIPVFRHGEVVLPWNIDTSEDFQPDVSMISYIGREHPVSYYGTQKGQTASWSTVIDKTDTDTLFKLRRLGNYMGDVYVREPSGTGYWANVKVSWSQTHNEPAIPVSLSITRVEGKPIDVVIEEEGGA